MSYLCTISHFILHFMFFQPQYYFIINNMQYYPVFVFWLRWIFVAEHGLSLVVASGDYSLLWYTDFSLQWLLLLWSMGCRHAGFSSCGTRAQQLWLAGSRAQAQQLQCMGLVAPQHVGSFPTRAQTLVPCIGRHILNHCTTREVLLFSIYFIFPLVIVITLKNILKPPFQFHHL